MESIEHLTIKKSLYDSLHKKGFKVTLEPNVLKSKPDIMIDNVCGNKLAIEIQKNYISVNTILSRMKNHTEAGAYTLWLIPESILLKLIYNKKWCDIIQKLQNGFVFLPYSEGRILPARIDVFLGKKKKYIDYYHTPIEINELTFENNCGYNLTYWKEWWLEGYMEILELGECNSIRLT